ncbi:hypothetical protein ACWF9B_08750 [Streptomyces sp. NPDC055089]
MTPQQENSRSSSTRGGLPEGDADLAALANSALKTSRSGTQTAPSGPPQPAGASATPVPAAPSPAPPQPRAAASVPSPETPDDAAESDTGAYKNRFTQVTSIVDVQVLERFKAYQLQQKIRTGEDPSNTVVVFRAINAAVKAKQLEELNAPPEEETDDFLSIHAPGRRTSRERRRTDQLSWRPTFGNLAMIDGLVQQFQYKDRSRLINVVLDAFLPELKRSKRSKG